MIIISSKPARLVVLNIGVEIGCAGGAPATVNGMTPSVSCAHVPNGVP
jgi:hypothetical protein